MTSRRDGTWSMLSHQWPFLGHGKPRNYPDSDRENKKVEVDVGYSFVYQKVSKA